MTEFNYIDTENKWDQTGLPRVYESGVLVSAWMTDAEIAGQAATLTAVYGNEFEIDMALRLFRAQLRAAALDTATETLVTEAATIVGNMTHLITHATTDSELAAYADAAESGAGGPVDGLYEELVRLRDSEREQRVFVAEAGAPRVTNLHEQM
ncbi:hypothetical protein [Mycolicibacterium brisbanense]